MYNNSEIYRNLISNNKSITIKPQTNFSLMSDSPNDTLFKRYAFYSDNNINLSLSPYYKLNSGKISISIVSSSGKTVYQSKLSSSFNENISVNLDKGFFTVVLQYEMEHNKCEGQINISGTATNI